ncbi:unannotated protein [freshwater metagenome]|uniref:Unannotated protein n=2 Tax=freshwater metagenome TaxID=449393 RepID=A0A6J7V3S0_9ZZZZ|nr:hypothetical protein [Actinomycetota bacterium]MTA67133.1 hypothetical protein [Actinomycetota bacterium]
MKNISKKVLVGAVAFALVLPASFTFSQGASAASPVKGGNLTILRGDLESSLTPSIPPDNAGIWVVEEIFDTLLLPAQDAKSLKPSLATSWSASKDGLTWTFKLRAGVKFSDGKPMTSKDVKFSLQENSNPAGNWGFINSSISKIGTPDPLTVTVTTKTPYSPLPAVMAIFANSIVPYNYGGKTKEAFGKSPIGTGPFKLATWTKGQLIKLVRNPYYWEAGKPYLDSVTFKLVPDSNTRANQVQGGQAQVNEFPSYSSVKTLKSVKGVKVTAFDSSAVNYLIFNNTKAPLTDVHVRKALAYLVDKKAIIAAVTFGIGTAAGAYMSPTSWAHNASIKGLPYNVAKAKAELALSTQPNGFEASINVASGSADENSKAQILQSEAAKIGITLKINQLDPSAWTAARDAKTYDIMFGYCTTDIIDPDEIIRFAGLIDGGGSSLWSYYDNQASAKLANDAVLIDNQAKRKAIYDKIQLAFDADQPMVPLYYAPNLYSYSTKVQNFHPFVTGNYNFRNVWLTK